MTQLWYIRLLGGLSASQNGQSVTRFPTLKTGGLLAYLAFYREQRHPREALMERFWADSTLDKARSSLSVALSALRSQFEHSPNPEASSPFVFLLADRSTVRLHPDAFTTDVQAFLRVRDAASRAGTDTEAVALLEEAEGLYGGELLPGFYEDWVVSERERIADTRLQMLHRLVALLTESGNLDRALEYSHRAVQTAPFDDESRRLLKQAQLLAGRTPLGKIERAVLAPEGSGATGEAEETPLPLPSPGARESRCGGIPLRFTRFFGRTDEVARIREWFVDERAALVTLTGMGGVGKTRLSQEAADRLRDHFTGGVFFAPLADLREPDLLLGAVRDALCVSGTASSDPLRQIGERIAAAPGPCLLVLDNLEQLLGRGPLDSAGGAAVIRTLRENIPRLQLLVTSRQPLGLEYEREFPVPPLPVPPATQPASPEKVMGYAAVQLFADRVKARRVDFRITPNNAGAVAALCGRLDGVPLAIELVAARARLFTPSQMLERLAEGFALLESRHPDLPARHRSLRAVAEWSYRLLPPDEQLLFARLSVFRGGWDVEAAESVCGDGDAPSAGRILESLTRLRGASLLLADEIPIGAGTEMRVRLPEPLREFADDLLDDGEREEINRRHSAYFVARAESAFDHLRGPAQLLWFDRLEADHDNFRSALGRHRPEEDTGLRIAGALARFWWTRGHHREGAQWLERVIPTGESDFPAAFLSRAFSGAGSIAYEHTDFARARAFFQESLRLERERGDSVSIGSVLHNLGNIAYREGDYDTAWKLYSEGLTLYRQLDDRWNIASELGSLGNVADAKGNYAEARELQEECLAMAQELGDQRMAAYTLHNLGNLAARDGDPTLAHSRYEASMVLTRLLGDRRHIGTLLTSLAALDLQAGETEAAYAGFREALPILQQIGDRLNQLHSLEGIACCKATQGGTELLMAARLWGASEAARELLNSPLWQTERDEYETYIQAARSRITHEGAFDSAWNEGRNLSLEEAIQLALKTPTGTRKSTV